MTTTPAIMDYSQPPDAGGFWTQTAALLTDAYRDLHSKKLFWITLVLSLLVVVSFAFVGINETGITIFGKEFPGIWNTTLIPRDTFYKWMFTTLAIPWWLGFFAAILALVSVGGMFPDMLTGGSIDLYLSKPISRLRLFLTKYVFGLLFVALQVFVFSAASFLVIGIRGGAWEPKIFLAVPLVTLFFSYLYCICALLGILTRSTLAAILLTMLVWFALFAINSADGGVLAFRTAADRRVESIQRTLSFNEEMLAKNAALPEDKRGDLKNFEFQRDKQRENLDSARSTADSLRFWHNLVLGIKTPLPKTGETVELMNRWLVDPDPFFAAEQESHDRRETRRAERGRSTTRNIDNLETYMHEPETVRQISDTVNARKVSWIIGTSLGFEIFVLALAAWVFCRRDY